MSLNPDTIKRLSQMPEGQELKEFITNRITSLNTTHDIEHTNDRDIAVEVVARKRAVTKLAEILSGLHYIEEKPIHDPEIY